jgi:Ferritin-like domain/TAT (twin-arginine translocation) pathway signal sequence
VDKLSELANKRSINRRKFLAGVGAAGAATALAGCGSSQPVVTTPTSTAYTDADILNFALNLEYLEAEFYLRAATGSGLATADIGTSPGSVTGGAQVAGLTTAQANILNEIAYDEQAHVRFLRTALGASAVVRPTIDLTNSFNALAAAAGIGSTFNPFASFSNFLIGAFIFEDVGVTAYNGAAPAISTAGITAGYLAAAAGIMAVEAYHAAYVRTAITASALGAGGSATLVTYAAQVATLRGTLGGGNETMLTIPTGTAPFIATVPTPSAIVAATSANAIAFARSTDQVLHIVYGTGGSAGVRSGGFFPSGLNGNITVTQS